MRSFSAVTTKPHGAEENLGALPCQNGLIASVVTAVFYTAEGKEDHAATLLGYAIIPAVLVGLYFWARRQMPVKTDTVDQQSLTLSFNNSTYIDLFEQKNRESLR